VKIILVVNNSAHEKIYHDTISGYGLDCCIVDSLQKAITHASVEPHTGILIDIQVMLKVPKSLIDSIVDLLSGLPSATLNINRSSETIRILSRGELSSECFSIEQLMAVCTQFVPKIIYFRKRELVYYNVLLDRDPEFNNSPYNKTVCIDLSQGGCFVFCTWDDIAIGDDVWIKLPETVQPLPVKAVVCWIRKWGACQDIPGIGVKFCE